MKSRLRFFPAVVGLILVIMLAIMLPINSGVSSSASGVCSGKAMCVLDGESGRILYAKNAHERLPMASTTKVVTAITVIENCADLDEVIRVDDKAIGIEGTSIYLRKDEEISVRDLLYGLMLRSGNDSATALAIHTSGSVENFSKKMLELAVSVGAVNSHFMNPHGLDNPEHYTTAYDLALIASHALKNDTFKEIVSTKAHVIKPTNKSDTRYLTNKNRLLSSLNGCVGVKTGYTSKAGRCLVSAVERDGRSSVAVVLNCGPMFEESATLLNDSFVDYELVKIIDKKREIFNEYIIDEVNGKLFLYTDEDFYYPLSATEKDKIRIEYSVDLNGAKEGDEVGEIKIFLDKHLLKSLKLYTMNKIDKLDIENELKSSQILWEEKIDEN